MNDIPRDIIYGQEAQEKLKSGIIKMAKAVKSTLGAAGQTVLIESPNKVHGMTVSKDGVTVAKEVFFEDPVENLVAQMLRDAANRTAISAEDGTTTSTVITEALVLAGMEFIKPEHDKTEILREIHKITKEVLEDLKDYGVKLDESRLRDVATISANNDPFIGGLVASAYKAAGENALVSVNNSYTAETYIETTSGIKFSRGFDTPTYINSQSRDQCILENVYVLITDHKLESYDQIKKVLTHVVQNKLSLLIVGNCGRGMINTLGMNVVKGNVKVCSIVPPQFGYKSAEMMSDLAVALGGKFFSEKTGDDLSLVGIEDLGRASRIVVDRFSTIITKDAALNENISTRISELKQQILTTKKKSDIDHLYERIAILDGGMGVIFAGGNSDAEQKELFDRIEDAVGAVRSALEDGVIPGGGVPLLNIAHKIYKSNTNKSKWLKKTFDYMLGIKKDDKVESRDIACKILQRGLSEPFNQILVNSGKDQDKINEIGQRILENSDYGYGFDVKSDKYIEMFSAGILDPLKVTTNAVQNAVSVSTTILSTNAVITLARKKD